jgi:23S rRNA (cytidine1920-2'-O)/16S rRNA (cytidine1409-2'-O)-methyltransferase
VIASPIAGTHGNHEFLAWFRAGAPDPSASREALLRLAP